MAESEAARINAKRQREVHTIYLRCSPLTNISQLFGWLFYDYRASLGIEDWFELPDKRENDDLQRYKATLKKGKPISVAYADWSRKPYFLIEVEDAALEQLLLKLNGVTYKNSPLVVKLADEGRTVQSHKKKKEGRAAEPQLSSASVLEPTNIKLLPRVLRRK